MFWKKKNKPTAELASQVTFEVIAPEADRVELVGDFTNWLQMPLSLAKDSEGRWYREVSLNRGSYEYRYLVDGQWVNDPAARAEAPNTFGTTNSIISVDDNQ